MQALKFHIVSVLLAGMLFSCSNPSTGWADKALKRAEKQALAMAVQLDTLPGQLGGVVAFTRVCCGCCTKTAITRIC